MRGNRSPHVLVRHHLGSIPACAGEPSPAVGSRQYQSVYPRVCGGTFKESSWETRDRGLSPRVRGNPQVGEARRCEAGSIPACAGEPCVCLGWGRPHRVYPRVCGGTDSGSPSWSYPSGLSPRVRGNLQLPHRHIPDRRSIPACAGEPASITSRSAAARVYPRVCGGTSGSTRNAISANGLSPRVRGNPVSTDRITPRLRSIPACAGEPTGGAIPATAAGVYPRVCGGTLDEYLGESAAGGLSPRVRGNRAAPVSPSPARRGLSPRVRGNPAA